MVLCCAVLFCGVILVVRRGLRKRGGKEGGGLDRESSRLGFWSLTTMDIVLSQARDQIFVSIFFIWLTFRQNYDAMGGGDSKEVKKSENGYYGLLATKLNQYSGMFPPKKIIHENTIHPTPQLVSRSMADILKHRTDGLIHRLLPQQQVLDFPQRPFFPVIHKMVPATRITVQHRGRLQKLFPIWLAPFALERIMGIAGGVGLELEQLP